MIKIVPFAPEHIRLLSDPEREPGLLLAVSQNSAYWESVQRTATAFSGFMGDEFLGSGGFCLLPWGGSAEVWLWAMASAKKYPQQLHKLIKRALNHIETAHDVKRISCQVRCKNEMAERWVEMLGFEAEGVLRKWGPGGSDFTLYARVRE